LEFIGLFNFDGIIGLNIELLGVDVPVIESNFVFVTFWFSSNITKPSYIFAIVNINASVALFDSNTFPKNSLASFDISNVCSVNNLVFSILFASNFVICEPNVCNPFSKFVIFSLNNVGRYNRYII